MRKKNGNELVGIIGTGRFGMAVAEELLARGRDVIAIDKDFFFGSHGLVEARNGLIHIFQQKRIIQIGQLWSEKFLSLLFCFYPSLSQKCAYGRAYRQGLCQSFFDMLFFFGKGHVVPFAYHYIVFYRSYGLK